MPDRFATYSRSLRAQALAFHNRAEDRAVLAAGHALADQRIASRARTATASPRPARRSRPRRSWDNSNSQYGVLGVWAAAEAGLAVPGIYWTGVQSHWERTQLKTGGWDYGKATAGERHALDDVGRRQHALRRQRACSARSRPDTQIARAALLRRACSSASTGSPRATTPSHSRGNYPYYTLYGMERAGLASGFKMFGQHDWFRVLAADTLKKQRRGRPLGRRGRHRRSPCSSSRAGGIRC